LANGPLNAEASRKRFKAKVREVFRKGRGQSLTKTIQQLIPSCEDGPITFA